MGFLWDLCQSWQISEAQARADVAQVSAKRVESKSDRQQHQLNKLEQQVDRLSLIVTALCEQLIASGTTTAAQLQNLIETIDLRDGQPDGRLRLPVQQCPACERPSHPHRTHCLYCGEKLEGPPAVNPPIASTDTSPAAE